MTRASLQLFGGFVALSEDGRTVPLTVRKAAALIGLLAVDAGRSRHRARICSLLWEDAGETQSRASLRQLLAAIRRAFGPHSPIVVAEGETLCLSPDVDVDVARFQELAQSGRDDDVMSACELFRGDLLEGLQIDSSSFEAWLAGERMRLRDLAASAILDDAGRRPDRALLAARMSLAQRLLALDPSHEGLHRAVMSMHASQGRLADALKQYERCRQILHKDLGVRPDALTEQLVREIRSRRIARRSAEPTGDALPIAAPRPASHAPDGDSPRQAVLRPVTVLHLDLSYLDDPPIEGDPEAQDALQSHVSGLVAHAASDYGGCLQARLGLVHVCLFGLDQAHGDDPLRTVRAALRIREQLASLRIGSGQAIRFRAGMAFGALLVRDRGDEGTRNVSGEALDEARKLAQSASPGEIVVAAELAPALSGSVDLSHDESGRSPSIIQLSDRWRSQPPLPFIGRRVELVQFEQMLAAARSSGSGAAVIIRGEPGIGKTRLIAEIERMAGAMGFGWHMAVLEDLPPGVMPDPIATIARSMMRACGGGLGAEPDANAHPGQIFMDDLIGQAQPSDVDSAFGGLAASEWEAGRKQALTDLLHSACQARPAVIVVENIHWIDERSLNDISTLANAMAEYPCVLVLTTRIPEPERKRPLAEWHSLPVTRLTLKLFSATEAEAFAQSFPAAAMDEPKRILDLSGGNPLFLDQLLRSSNTDIKRLANIASTVLARLDALPDIDRCALDAASVLHRAFDEDTIRFMVDDSNYDIGSLVDHGLLRASPGGLSFVHLVVKDVVRASLLTAARRNWNHRAALWFEGKDAGRRATHLENAGDPAAPSAYLQAARHEVAERRFERALALAERGWLIATDPDQRFEIAMASADLWRQLGRTAQAMMRYADAAQIATCGKARAQAELGIAAAARMTGDVSFGMQTLDRALEHLDARRQSEISSDPCALEHARIAYYRGSFHFLRGEIDDCAKMQDIALAQAIASGEPDWIARAYGGVGDADHARGDMHSAILNFRKALSYAARSKLADAEIANRVALASARQFIGELRQALADADEAAGQAARLNNLYIEMQALNVKADLLIDAEQFDRAKHALDRALAICTQLGNSRFKASLLGSLGRLHLCEGDLHRAEINVDRALDAARQSDPGFVGPKLHALKARIDAALYCTSDALAEGRAILDANPSAQNALWFERDAIEACIAAGQPDLALEHVDRLFALGRRWSLPWALFFAARGRALLDFSNGAPHEELEPQLMQLARQAEADGFLQALTALAEAAAAARTMTPERGVG